MATYFRYWSQTAIQSNNVHVYYFLKICWYMTLYMHICDPTTNSYVVPKNGISFSCFIKLLPKLAYIQSVSAACVPCQLTWEPLLLSMLSEVSTQTKNKCLLNTGPEYFALSQPCLSFGLKGALEGH